MALLIGFVTAVAVTVLFLVVVVVTGLRGRISLHIPCVLATLVSLSLSIALAIRLEPYYDLKAAGVITPIHLAVAKLAAASYVLPIITGIRTLRSREHRRAHFWCAMLVLALTATASITGTLMLLWAPKIESLPG
jgi:hypothetical protein